MRTKWLPLIVACVGILNVWVVTQAYLLQRLVVNPAAHDADSSPRAESLRRLDAQLATSEIKVVPEGKGRTLRNIVQLAESEIRDNARMADAQLVAARSTLRSVLIICGLQNLVALIPFVPRKTTPSTSDQ